VSKISGKMEIFLNGVWFAREFCRKKCQKTVTGFHPDYTGFDFLLRGFNWDGECIFFYIFYGVLYKYENYIIKQGTEGLGAGTGDIFSDLYCVSWCDMKNIYFSCNSSLRRATFPSS
jgi:hypothetical protein